MTYDIQYIQTSLLSSNLIILSTMLYTQTFTRNTPPNVIKKNF